MDELQKTGRFKKVSGVELPAVLEVLREEFGDEIKRYNIYSWDGKSEPDKELGRYDAVVFKLVAPFLSDDELGLILENLKRYVLADNSFVVLSLPHPLNVRKKHRVDLSKQTIYDELIPNTYNPNEEPIPIKVIYRPKRTYEKIFKKHDFVLQNQSEPTIPAHMLQDLPQDYGEFPYRLNLLFKKVSAK